ncbi:ABC transporter permease [Anoxybacterium hadale]|uniref:ABC transporter permease n=1 Tax=Anoxybacterium hadale TaxID=3408580 RepID=A0ACD1A700_9FIRM|nr:ABC transporter permease [Clostridiales bacterium]
MNLFSLARRNIRLNGKKYSMYLFSMGFSVFTVYTFLALMRNEIVKAAFRYDVRYQSLLSSFAVIILVFVLFFLISSNNSFIRARKKELSTYALFGMPNRRIGGLLFLETALVGLGMLAAGIGLGIFFSKLMAMILLEMTLVNFAGKINFSIDPAAVYQTAVLFGGIFCIMGLSGWRVVSRFELVDLFKADKVSEKKSKGSTAILILSVLLMGAGYFIAVNKNPYVVVVGSIPILILVILGTYLFFWGGLPKVLGMVKRKKALYYKGANLISVSAVSHRMRSVASVMATIAVLSAVAVTAVATGFTLYANAERNTYSNVGFDLTFKSGEETVQESISELLRKNDVKVLVDEELPLYETDTPKTSIEMDGMPLLTPGNPVRVYSESDFSKLVSLSKTALETASVASGEALFLFPYSPDRVEEAMIGQELDMSGFAIKVTEVGRSNISGFGMLNTLVLNDGDFAKLLDEGKLSPSFVDGKAIHAAVYNYEGALKNRQLNQDLKTVLESRGVKYSTAYGLYNESMETFGLICFIGFFMSGVFILMTASLLYFKQIMAAEEERHQYRTLRRIGLDVRTERQVVRRRLLPVFFIPLAMGILHSVFAMKTADTVVFSHMIPATNSYLYVLGFSAVMYGVYGLVYAIFYWITKSQYGRIVRS